MGLIMILIVLASIKLYTRKKVSKLDGFNLISKSSEGKIIAKF